MLRWARSRRRIPRRRSIHMAVPRSLGRNRRLVPDGIPDPPGNRCCHISPERIHSAAGRSKSLHLGRMSRRHPRNHRRHNPSPHIAGRTCTTPPRYMHCLRRSLHTICRRNRRHTPSPRIAGRTRTAPHHCTLLYQHTLRSCLHICHRRRTSRHMQAHIRTDRLRHIPVRPRNFRKPRRNHRPRIPCRRSSAHRHPADHRHRHPVDRRCRRIALPHRHQEDSPCLYRDQLLHLPIRTPQLPWNPADRDFRTHRRHLPPANQAPEEPGNTPPTPSPRRRAGA